MKRDYITLSIIVGTVLILLNVFFNEYLLGLNIPLLLAGLGFIGFAIFKQKQAERNYARRKNDKNKGSK